MKLTHISLFSGIGGDSLAANWAGFETVMFCEIDKFCQQVLKKHWPDVPIVEDVRNVTRKEQETVYSPPITLVTGGVPCQPASTAGKRKGKADDRWLWPEAIRVVREFKPSWVCFENVGGLITLDNGLAFDSLLSDLEGAGYEVQPFVIPACAVNAPHRRDRVFIVAHAECPQWRPHDERGRCVEQGEHRERETAGIAGKCGKVLAEPVGLESGSLLRNAPIKGLPNWAGGTAGQPFPLTEFERPGGEDVADTENPNRWRDGRTEENTGRRRPEAGGQSGAGIREWEIERIVCRVSNGISVGLDGYTVPVRDRVPRLKALGNAIVPQQIYPILKAIADYEMQAVNMESERNG